MCKQAAGKAVNILHLVEHTRSKQHPINRGHDTQSGRKRFSPLSAVPPDQLHACQAVLAAADTMLAFNHSDLIESI